jgi:hypothetical protein
LKPASFAGAHLVIQQAVNCDTAKVIRKLEDLNHVVCAKYTKSPSETILHEVLVSKCHTEFVHDYWALCEVGFYTMLVDLYYNPPGEGKRRERGRKKEREKGTRERKKRRRYESIAIHCNEEEVEKKSRLITELEHSIA